MNSRKQRPPLVSVIVPVYNGERYLASALQSAFQQNYYPLEVIVVDDGSTDNSAEISRSFKNIHYIFQSNQGVAVARNTGIAAAQGEFIAFLDADDLWPPIKLRMQIDYLSDHPEVSFTVGRIRNFLEPGIKRPPTINARVLLEKEHVGLITLVAHKKVFEKIGPFNPYYKVGSDFEWVTRAKDAGLCRVILPEILVYRRIHDSNLSIYQSQMIRENFLRMFKASIDHQRQQKHGRSKLENDNGTK